MPKSPTENWERKPSISRTLPHPKRSRHSGAKYGRTTRPITMVPTGSKTKPRKKFQKSFNNNIYKDLEISRLSECGGSKQQQSQWLWEPLAPSRRT